MAVEINKNEERVNWVKSSRDNMYIYYRKSDERNCGYVDKIYDSTDWRAFVEGAFIGQYRTQVAAQRAVEKIVEPEIVPAVAFPVK